MVLTGSFVPDSVGPNVVSVVCLAADVIESNTDISEVVLLVTGSTGPLSRRVDFLFVLGVSVLLVGNPLTMCFSVVDVTVVVSASGLFLIKEAVIEGDRVVFESF